MIQATKLPVQTGVSAMQMAETMFGGGITIVGAAYKGDPISAGLYSGADLLAPGVAPADKGVILSTGRASDFTNASGDVNVRSSTTTNTNGIDGDAGLNEIAGTKTYDAAIFEARFVPQGSILTMQITFSSEEYLEYVGSGFNDAVGVWVNGTKAELTVGDGDISINNINPKSNSGLYVDNAGDGYNTEMDGFTITLTLKAHVKSGEVNDIRIGIADGGDTRYDSNLLIAADSVQTEVVALDDSYDVRQDGSTTLNLLENDINRSKTALFITAINGQPVHAGSHVMLPDGTEIVVGEGGLITVVTDGTETPGDHSFTYEVTNANGITDTGIVHGHIACFVTGSRIMTDRGFVAINALRPGDVVQTLDHGLQRLRWCGRRTVPSQGAFAAVSIPAGTFGDHGGLRVSPQHRLLVTGWRVELYSGEDQVLVKAVHLVRAGLLRQDNSGCPVTYHHLLFDHHEIINAEGLWSESYLPGPMTLPAHDEATQSELFTLFPELEADPSSYGPPARPEVDARLALLIAAP